MNTKQIDYILELSQTLNFNQAAENLFISQPTLSYQIKSAEDEVGFKIFNRDKSGVSLTPAGYRFCNTLRTIQLELRDSIEQNQNLSSLYSDHLSIGLQTRSCIHFLPEAIKQFSKQFPSVDVTPIFTSFSDADEFLNGRIDINFALEESLKRVPNITAFPLYKSRVYLVTKKDDVLAEKSLIHKEDLAGRRLMVGGDSPALLRKVQSEIITSLNIPYFNSINPETTWINIAADKGICLAPGFLNDHNGEFAWIPYDCDERFNCNLYYHSGDERESTQAFLKILKRIYEQHKDFDF